MPTLDYESPPPRRPSHDRWRVVAGCVVLVLGAVMIVTAVRHLLEPLPGSPVVVAATVVLGLILFVCAWEFWPRSARPSLQAPRDEPPEPASPSDMVGMIMAGIVIFFIVAAFVAVFGT